MLSIKAATLKKTAIAGLAAVMLTACTTYRPVDESFHEVLTQPYTLDSGDRIRVTVFGQTDLTNTYAVDKGGYLAFPLVGSVQARGQTAKQIEGSIAAKLRNGYLRNPDVSVEIDRYRPIFVMGEVGSPGQYSYVPGMTVQNAIALSGGFTGRALQDNADITRQVNGQVLNGRVPLSDPIVPGDTVYIRERLF
ncbi:MAG: polysaccharide biosynthesis/export family protein [Rhizobiaceae bacterium]